MRAQLYSFHDDYEQELCDAKTRLNIFIIVLPIQYLAGLVSAKPSLVPAKPSFGLTLITKYNL